MSDAGTIDRAETEPRKRARRDGRFVTDAELIRRLNVPEKIARQAIQALDANPRSGFPQKQKLWGDRRDWKAVEAYIDRTSGLTIDASLTNRGRP